MNVLRSKFAAWVVAVALVAANHVCACATWLTASGHSGAGRQQAASAAMQPDHSCCRHDADAKPGEQSSIPAQDQNPQDDPCERCNIRTAAPTTLPEPLNHAAAQLDLLPWPQPAQISAAGGMPDAAHQVSDGNLLISPLLVDLFHSHCLLTN